VVSALLAILMCTWMFRPSVVQKGTLSVSGWYIFVVSCSKGCGLSLRYRDGTRQQDLVVVAVVCGMMSDFARVSN